MGYGVGVMGYGVGVRGYGVWGNLLFYIYLCRVAKAWVVS